MQDDLTKIPEQSEIDKLESQSIKRFVQENRPENQNKITLKNLEKKFWAFWSSNTNFKITSVYLKLISFVYLGFFFSIKGQQNGELYLVEIFFTLFSIFYLIYLLNYIFNFHGGNPINRLILINATLITDTKESLF